ncbi:DUF4870 family protein [Pistricoccus aurantiacus]|uniref:DUF4870 family protein n=1 Tax=Pistricoccus aurantiacus TaxID=1883414 RepID=UPI00362B38E3
MISSMPPAGKHGADEDARQYDDAQFAAAKVESPGRKAAILVYALYLGSIMAVVTAPIGVAIAHFKLKRSADWVRTHLSFQIRTFWFGVMGGFVGLGMWQVLGSAEAPSWQAWTFGYLLFTVYMIWMIGRCAVGILRLTSNRPIANPRSLGFGGARITLDD